MRLRVVSIWYDPDYWNELLLSTIKNTWLNGNDSHEGERERKKHTKKHLLSPVYAKNSSKRELTQILRQL